MHSTLNNHPHAPIHARSRPALSAAVAALSDLSDEAVEWLFGVALNWVATVAVDLPSLDPAGRHLLGAALEAGPEPCRAGLGMLLRQLAAGEWGLLGGLGMF
jgi:hypothetical protein